MAIMAALQRFESPSICFRFALFRPRARNVGSLSTPWRFGWVAWMGGLDGWLGRVAWIGDLDGWLGWVLIRI